MIGSGVKLKGQIDFDSADVPKGDLRITFNDVDPSSLDLGVNIHDKMTMESHLQGPLNDINGDGQVIMHELHIPGLEFQNVIGNIHYDGEKLVFSDVLANVYGGQLMADGVYDLDTRYYTIHGKGTGLQTAQALPNGHLYCSVDLDMFLSSKGSGRETTSYGEFSSGEGRYKIMPFKRISGKFRQGYRDLEFENVIIEFAGFTMATDALQIKEGKLTLKPVRLQDNRGNLLGTYKRD